MGNFEIVIGKSLALTCLFLTLYVGAVLVLLYLPIPLFLKIISSILLCSQLWKTLQNHARRSARNAIIHIWQDASGQWGCRTRGGYCARARVLEDSFKSPLLFILRLGLKHRSVNVIIPFDAINEREYKTLSSHFNLLK